MGAVRACVSSIQAARGSDSSVRKVNGNVDSMLSTYLIFIKRRHPLDLDLHAHPLRIRGRTVAQRDQRGRCCWRDAKTLASAPLRGADQRQLALRRKVELIPGAPTALSQVKLRRVRVRTAGAARGRPTKHVQAQARVGHRRELRAATTVVIIVIISIDHLLPLRAVPTRANLEPGRLHAD